MANNKKKKRWLIEIWPDEGELVVFRDDGSFLQHVRGNDPDEYGSVVLADDDDAQVRKLFREDLTLNAVGIVWTPYVDALGYGKVPIPAAVESQGARQP